MTSDEAARIQEIYQRLIAASASWDETSMSPYVGQPFKALITAMLSAQTREEQTTAAANALFAKADTAEAMAQLSDDEIADAIRMVAYPASKTRYVRSIAEGVAANGGIVPRDLDALMQYKGVGWKVAVLTLATGYGINDNITVDIHVLRIGIRLGLLTPDTKQPPKANDQLKKVLPREMWERWNALMVMFGRNICQPTYPRCPKCFLNDLCPQVGVVKMSAK